MIQFLLAILTATAAPPAEDKGWELRIALAKPDEPVFVGEHGEEIRVTVTLKNTTEKERGYVPPQRAVSKHVLDANIQEPDGKFMQQMCMLTPPDDFKNLTPLAAGKAATFEVKPSDFAFNNFRKAGKHTLQLTYSTPEGKVASNALAFAVFDPAKDDILARHTITPGGRVLQRPPDERESAYIDQVRVGGKVYLLYREYVGPKYGGGCDFARRLDALPGKVDVVVVGAHGGRLPEGWERFVLAYPHKKNGMTTLRIQSVGCEIEEKLVFEPQAGDDPKQGWALFEKCKFSNRNDYPPEKLRLTYAAFVASVKNGGVAKFCLNSVEVGDQEDPKRGEYGTGINIPWMKKHFSAEVLGCRNDPNDTFLIRTGTSYLFWVQTRSGEWKLFKYGDKPID